MASTDAGTALLMTKEITSSVRASGRDGSDLEPVTVSQELKQPVFVYRILLRTWSLT